MTGEQTAVLREVGSNVASVTEVVRSSASTVQTMELALVTALYRDVRGSEWIEIRTR